MKIILACLACSLMFASTSMAATSDITSGRRADFYAAGKHQFYAWCGNGQDRIVRQDGASASDARTRAVSHANGCRLSWQGRIVS
jgi:hypothetical protein